MENKIINKGKIDCILRMPKICILFSLYFLWRGYLKIFDLIGLMPRMALTKPIQMHIEQIWNGFRSHGINFLDPPLNTIYLIAIIVIVLNSNCQVLYGVNFIRPFSWPRCDHENSCTTNKIKLINIANYQLQCLNPCLFPDN